MTEANSNQHPPSLFAPYEPKTASAFRTGGQISIRPAQATDTEAIAKIAMQREGGLLEDHYQHTTHHMRSGTLNASMFVAVADNEVVAFGKTSFFDPPTDSPPNIAPRGWYLAGLIVHPDHRRRGIGMALTNARLSWLARRTTQALYFCNARNLASIALHERCGFVELTHDFTFPGATFESGVGVLCSVRLDRSDKAAAAPETAWPAVLSFIAHSKL